MTTRSEGAEQVRGYLLSQGEKYSFRELWVRVTQPRLELLKVIEGVTDEQASFRPDGTEWSILEVLDHLVTSSGRVASLVDALANGHTRGADDIEVRQEPGTQTLDAMREQLLRDSVAWATLTERLPDPPSSDATASHVAFGDLPAKAWYLFQRIHDTDHIGQIAKNKQAAGYPEG